MMRLIEKDLTTVESAVLSALQNRVNAETDFTKRIQKAESLWQTKGGEKGKNAFKTIKNMLIDMCVGVKICNYCEKNEANDIEHILAKSFFPELAFIWENYLLACKQCNSGHKLAKCFVLDVHGNLHDTVAGQEPIHKTVAFINPRLEDPTHFLWLNLYTGKFEIHEDLSLKDANKADKTLEILELNQRDTLIEGRKAAARDFYDKMDKLQRMLKSNTIIEIEAILDPYQDIIDTTLPLIDLKTNLKTELKQYIQKRSHPSVWHAIKTIESQVNAKWQNIFREIPEALSW